MSNLKQPLIPQADPVDGLLTLEALQQPIFIHLQAWGVFESGDSYQLTWNGTPLGEKKYLRDERPGDPLTLVIPAQLLEKDGAYDIGYVAALHRHPNRQPQHFTLFDATRPGVEPGAITRR